MVRGHGMTQTRQKFPGTWRHRMPIGMLVLLLVAFGLRVILLDASSFWLDEMIQVKLAATPLRAGFLTNVFTHAHVPVDILITKTLLKLGHQDFWLRLSAAFAGTLSVAVFYRLARDYLPAPAPLLAALLLTLAPLALGYNREVRPYSTLVLLALCSILFFLRALEEPWYWPLFVVSMVLTLHTHLFAMALLPSFAIYLLVIKVLVTRQRRWTQVLPGLISLAGVVVVFLLSPLTPNYVGRVMQLVLQSGVGGTVQQATVAKTVFGFPSLATLLVKLPADLGGIWPGGWPAVALAGLGIYQLRRQPRFLLFVLLWLVLPVVTVLFVLARQNHWYNGRYIIYSLPALLLLMTGGMLALMEGLSTLGRHLQWRRASQVLPLVVPALVVIGLAPGLPASITPENENWRALGAYLQANYDPGTLVVVPMAAPYLSHYAPGVPMVNLQSGAEVEAKAQHFERTLVAQSVYSQLGPPNDLWINPGNQLEHFEPGIDVYRAPAGAMASQRLSERQIRVVAQEKDPQAKVRKLWELGMTGRQGEQWELAIAALSELAGLTPDNPDVWTELGFAYQRQQDYPAAVDAYRRALAINPRLSWAHLLLANVLRAQGQAEAALVEARQATELAPRLPQTWDALGHTQLALGQSQDALASFEQGLQLISNDISLASGRARALTALNDSRASDAWMALLVLKPPQSYLVEACAQVPQAPACDKAPKRTPTSTPTGQR